MDPAKVGLAKVRWTGVDLRSGGALCWGSWPRTDKIDLRGLMI